MPNDHETLSTLQHRAFDLRIDNLTAISAAASGHPGGTLSAMDILQALFFREMRHRPNAGYFSRDLLPTLRRLGSPMQGHPANFLTPGIEASTGSLGQGFSIAIGMALASKMDGDRSCVGKTSIGGLRSTEPALAASNRKPQ